MKIKGFTLAEVLITLVVIGVVAAISVPTLMGNYRRTENTAKIKKIYSVMNNAIKKSVVDNAVMSDEWDHVGITGEEFFNKYLKSYINHTQVMKNTGPNNNRYRVYLADGTYMEFLTRGMAQANKNSSCYTSCIDSGTSQSDCIFNCADAMCTAVFYDINGDRKPNESERDIYRFGICGGILFKQFKINYFDALPPANEEFTTVESRSEVMAECKRNPGFGACTKLLRMDGWEFKPDYPWRV